MNISPVSFTGIKNIGFAKISKDTPEIQISRNILNMELTNDVEHKDLSEYKKILKNFPTLKNNINDKFVNIEMTSIYNNTGDLTFIPRLNGQVIPFSQKTKPILNFMHNFVDRVFKLKTNDFKIDPKYVNSYTAYKGLIYNEELDNYITGISGELNILKGTGVIENFANYLYKQGNELTTEGVEYFKNTVEGVAEVLHNPQYVHNGSGYMDALMRGYKNLVNDTLFS